MEREFTTVMVCFEGSNKQYTYKTTILDFKVGDQAVVDALGQTKIVKIKQVHKTPRLDPDARFKYKWIICKVDRKDYEKQLRLEKKTPVAQTLRGYTEHEDYFDFGFEADCH